MLFGCPTLSLSGMPSDEMLELDERVPNRLRDGDNRMLDVFACVRQHMSDDYLAQKPLLVMPQTLIGETENFVRKINQARRITPSLTPERQEEIRDLAREIREDFPHLSRSVAFYETLLDENRPLEAYPPIKFISQVARSGNRWCQFNLGERQPRQKPHLLQVKFHRGRWIWSEHISESVGLNNQLRNLGRNPAADNLQRSWGKHGNLFLQHNTGHQLKHFNGFGDGQWHFWPSVIPCVGKSHCNKHTCQTISLWTLNIPGYPINCFFALYSSTVLWNTLGGFAHHGRQHAGEGGGHGGKIMCIPGLGAMSKPEGLIFLNPKFTPQTI